MNAHLLYTAEKDRQYTMSELDDHCKSSFHTCKARLRRTFKHNAVDGKLKCGLCGHVCSGATEFIEHIKKEHPSRMWGEE
jgi:hypothetical protein